MPKNGGEKLTWTGDSGSGIARLPKANVRYKVSRKGDGKHHQSVPAGTSIIEI